MKVLLDTCTFLWVALGDERLSSAAAEAYQNPDHEVFLSTISAWEISVKHSLGRLPLPEPPEKLVPALRKDRGITSLPLDEESALHLTRLPALHRDPFDRMLICQAIVGGMVLLTPDRLITQYPVRTIW